MKVNAVSTNLVSANRLNVVKNSQPSFEGMGNATKSSKNIMKAMALAGMMALATTTLATSCSGGGGGCCCPPATTPSSNPAGGQPSNPTGGQQSRPSDNIPTNPTGGQTTDPTGGQTTNPTGGQTTDPTGGQTTNPTGGQTTDPTVNPTTSSTIPSSYNRYFGGKLASALGIKGEVVDYKSAAGEYQPQSGEILSLSFSGKEYTLNTKESKPGELVYSLKMGTVVDTCNGKLVLSSNTQAKYIQWDENKREYYGWYDSYKTEGNKVIKQGYGNSGKTQGLATTFARNDDGTISRAYGSSSPSKITDAKIVIQK